MKKNIGSQLALYPAPVTVIGAMDGAKADKSELFQSYLNEAGKINYRT